MKLIALKAFTDNYIWMLHNAHEAVVVDPGQSVPVLQALVELKLTLVGILLTHHHADHVGGVGELLPHLQGKVYGSAKLLLHAWASSWCSFFHEVHEGDVLSMLGQRFEVWHMPGHTADHMGYVDTGSEPVVFCGDTLFSAGCGRVFDGTVEQLARSIQRINGLAPQTRVCCAHEYTLDNLRFASCVEPYNEVIQSHRVQCERLRSEILPTLPSTLELERHINPFLRCQHNAVVQSAMEHGAAQPDGLSVFVALRSWKNEWK